MQLGIFVRGKTTAKRRASEELTFSGIDFEKFGSLNLLVTQFPRALMPYDFLNELKDKGYLGGRKYSAGCVYFSETG
jgi:hypothetical protein